MREKWEQSERIYLEIVRLGAGFHGRQRVYGRFGHFDLHHILRAQGGGMHIDMGYWRKQEASDTVKRAKKRQAGGGETDTNIQTQLTGRLAHTPE